MKKILFHPVILAVLFMAHPSIGQNETSMISSDRQAGYPVSQKAHFQNLGKYIADNLEYPELAQKNSIEGAVTVEALIGEGGEILSVGLVRGIGFGCDQELLRLVSNMPKWTPAVKNGRRMEQKVFIRTHFRLQ